MGLLEMLFIPLMFLPTIVMGIYKIWGLFWTFLIFDIIFVAVEIYYVKVKGYTVSQQFWQFSKKNRKKAFIVLGSMILMWASLIIHLACKMF